MDKGTLYASISCLERSIEEGKPPQLQNTLQHSISFGQMALPLPQPPHSFRSDAQPKRRTTYTDNNIWFDHVVGMTDRKHSNVQTAQTNKMLHGSSLQRPSLAELSGNSHRQPSNSLSKHNSVQNVHIDEHSPTVSNVMTPPSWKPPSALTPLDRQSSIPTIFGRRNLEAMASSERNENTVEAKGSDLLNGSAPDVDPIGHIPTHNGWTASGVSDVRQLPFSIGGVDSRSRFQEYHNLDGTDAFGLERVPGTHDRASKYPISATNHYGGSRTGVVIGSQRPKTIPEQSTQQTFQRDDHHTNSTLMGNQQHPGYEVSSSTTRPFNTQNDSTRGLLQPTVFDSHQKVSAPPNQSRQIMRQHQGYPHMMESPADHQLGNKNVPYFGFGGLNMSYPMYDEQLINNSDLDSHQTFHKLPLVFDKDNLSPSTTGHRSSWRSPDFSATNTPLTVPGSVRSGSGYGFVPRPMPHDAMILDTKLRNLDVRSREHSFTGSDVTNATHHHPPMPYSTLYPVGGMRMNPLASPYVSIPYAVNHASHRNGHHFARPGVREYDQNHVIRSPLLEEFRLQHRAGKRYELKDIYGCIVEFSGDQYGSRFIQAKLETANGDEKQQVFNEVQPNALQLMTDVFGNYVIQKMFEHGSQSQKKMLANQMKGHVLFLSTQMYGCRVVQKALEHVLVDQQASMVKELEGENTTLKVIQDGNGNHVIQKAIERVPGEHIQFIVDAHRGQVARLATHAFGCRVIQRMLEHCQPAAKRAILDECLQDIPSLITNQFGNYVVQHIIQNGNKDDRRQVVDVVQNQLLVLSKHKFASNVVEKSLEYADDDQRTAMLRQLTGPSKGGISPVLGLLRDQYGNYVIQKVVNQLQGAEKEALLDEIRHNLVQLRHTSYGRQVMAIEKLLFEAGAPPSLATSSRSSTSASTKTNSVADEALVSHSNPAVGNPETSVYSNQTCTTPRS